MSHAMLMEEIKYELKGFMYFTEMILYKYINGFIVD